MAKRLDPQIIERLSEQCVDELRNSVENGLLNEAHLVKLAKGLSQKVFVDTNKEIKRTGFGKSSIDCLLSAWYKHKSEEVRLTKLVKVLKSPDIDNGTLATKLEKVFTKAKKQLPLRTSLGDKNGLNNNMDVEQSPSPVSPEKNSHPFQRGGEIRMSKVILKKAQQKEEEANKKEKEAKKKEREAMKEKEEAKKIQEEARRKETEARRIQEEAKKENMEAKKKQEEAAKMEREAKKDKEDAQKLIEDACKMIESVKIDGGKKMQQSPFSAHLSSIQA